MYWWTFIPFIQISNIPWISKLDMRKHTVVCLERGVIFTMYVFPGCIPYSVTLVLLTIIGDWSELTLCVTMNKVYSRSFGLVYCMYNEKCNVIWKITVSGKESNFIHTFQWTNVPCISPSNKKDLCSIEIVLSADPDSKTITCSVTKNEGKFSLYLQFNFSLSLSCPSRPAPSLPATVTVYSPSDVGSMMLSKLLLSEVL